MMYIQFLLGITGFSLIITKSKLFKRPRMFFSEQYILKPESRFWFFCDSLMNCYMCLSIWAALVFYLLKLFVPEIYDALTWIFSASIATTIIIDIREWICRK